MHGGSALAEGSTGIWLSRATGFLVAACGGTPDAVEELAETGTLASLAAAPLQRSGRAYLERLEDSRLSIMCASLAAEAAVNAYVNAKRPSYRASLQKLSTTEQLALAPRLLSDVDLFPPSSRVYEDFARLFALRDELVHPWPRPASPGDPVDGGMGERFNPLTACRLLESVARVAKALGDLYEHPYRPAPSLALKAVEALGKRVEAAAALPAPTAVELDEEERLAAGAFQEDLIGA